ncbi:MAG: hypothetical protein MMC33_004299 [Icmadophila ericetorum]|nr:hypothetical protein [Icmadophila ericetorum]
MAPIIEKFVEESIVDILIPEASDLDIEEALGIAYSERESDGPVLSSIPQRDVLFFDERLSIFVVLQTPYQDESKIKSYISRLLIALEAHAINSSSAGLGKDAPAVSRNQARDVIWSSKLDVMQDPVIIVEEATDGEDARYIYVIWKMSAVMNRPRIRLQLPAILFKLSASIQPAQGDNRTDVDDPYLPSGVPFAVNLLQPLQGDPALKGLEPRLSSLRLSKVHPSGRIRRRSSENQPLKLTSRKAVRIMPVVTGRVRYTKPTIPRAESTMTATLDIEIPSSVQHVTKLKAIDVKLNDGKIKKLGEDHLVKLPLECHPRDNLVLLYHLTQNPGIPNLSTNPHFLDIVITATVLISPICLPRIEMRWRSNVEFPPIPSLPPLSSAKAPFQQRTGSRPTSLQQHSSAPQSTSTTPKTSIERSQSSDAASSAIGITLTITAPTHTITTGTPFLWEILVVNRSSHPRHLALIAIPCRHRKTDIRKAISRPFSSTTTSSGGGGKPTEDHHAIAETVLDENLLFAVCKSATQEGAQLVCLTTDVRIGPLAPESCISTSFRLMALVEGVVGLEAVRVVDLGTNEIVDVRDLPDVVVEGGKRDGGKGD